LSIHSSSLSINLKTRRDGQFNRQLTHPRNRLMQRSITRTQMTIRPQLAIYIAAIA